MLVLEKEKCCGCATCRLVCPADCITMQQDAAGFIYPDIDYTRCINCGRCEQVCPMLVVPAAAEGERVAWAAYAREEALRFSGSSGGMFGVMAHEVLRRGGVVYGAAFDSRLKLRLTSARKPEELVRLYQSKYLQSDLGTGFAEIARELEQGRTVLITATPCQIGALKKYLAKPYENLIAVDFFCHGVPSQSFFDRCIDRAQRRYGIRVLDFQFRSKKKNGATPYYFTAVYEKAGRVHRTLRLYLDSVFYRAFQTYLTLRESCYHCPYARGARAADITIGDFHHIDRYYKEIDRLAGVSTVIANTARGLSFLSDCAGALCLYDVDYQRLRENGDAFAGPTKKPPKTDAFRADLERDDFDTVIRRYFLSKGEYGKRLYYHMPKRVRSLMRKIIMGD